MTNIVVTLLFLAIGIGYMFLAKIWQDKRTAFDDDWEIGENSNIAVGLRKAGLYISMALALAGSLYGNHLPFLAKLKMFALDGLVALVVLALVGYINDKFILAYVDNDKEVAKGNTAVGWVELGGYLASGLILFASFTGEGGGILSAVIFSLLGQLALGFAYAIYECLTPYKLADQIREGNPAAGLAVAGTLFALGLVLMKSIAGPFRGWGTDLANFGLDTIWGFILLIVATYMADWLFLPKTTINTEVARDKNVAAVAMTNGVIVAVAIIVNALL